MGGGGSAQGMRNSLKANNMLLRKKSYFKKERTFLNRKREYSNAAKGVIDLKTATKEQLADIRNKIIKRRKRQNLVLLLVMILLVVPITYYSIDFINQNTELNLKAKNKIAIELHQKHLFLISDGDTYLEKGQWHNAIFQYNIALELIPNDYNTEYRIAYASVYRCRNEKENCKEADTMLQGLMKRYPDKSELIELERVLIFTES